MAAPRRVIEVSFSEKELSDLACVSRSRTEPASHVQRACILLTYREKPSLYATGRAIGVTHQTVERCLRRARKFGVMAALDDSPRPGREPIGGIPFGFDDIHICFWWIGEWRNGYGRASACDRSVVFGEGVV